jgi:hypothetical protein
MHPAPLVMAHRTRKKSAKYNLKIKGAPNSPSQSLPLLHVHLYLQSKSPNSSVRLAYSHTNRLINCLYLAGKEIR